MENTVRSISMNAYLVLAVMEAAVWTRSIAFTVYVHQQQEEAFVNKVRTEGMHCSTWYLLFL